MKIVGLYHPESGFVAEWNSDNAIAVLYVNDTVYDIFRFYFFGMDRYGPWIYLIPRLWHQFTGHIFDAWEVYSIHAFSYLALTLVGAYMLHRRWGVVTASLAVAVISLNLAAVYEIFQTCTPFAVQMSACFVAWACGRRLLDQYGLSWDGTERQPEPRKVWWLCFTLFFFFAVWASLVSAILLLACLGCEWLVRCVWQRLSLQESLQRGVLLLAPVLGVIAIERWCNRAYNRYTMQAWGKSFETVKDMDWGRMYGNFHAMTHTYLKSSWWGFGVLALILVGVLLAHIFTVLAQDKARRLQHAQAMDWCMLSWGALCMGGLNFVITGMSTWVRMSLYNTRYLAPTMVFVPFGVLAALVGLMLLWVKGEKRRWVVSTCVAVLAPVLVYFQLPAARPGNSFRETREAAALVAEKAPGSIILGGYWGTYLFPAALPEAQLVALPDERDTNRMPWMQKALQTTRSVVVSHFHYDKVSFDHPLEQFTQYGHRFELRQQKFISHGRYHFTLYENMGPVTAHLEVVDKGGQRHNL
ncbi:MAG: hypothetical protein OXT67_03710 [Zetaproteobacteria bacterium]|nr:hypothetical protein [Zetaproteobacteria bacterium]